MVLQAAIVIADGLATVAGTASTQLAVEVAEIYAHYLTVPALSDFKAEQ